MFKFIHTADIHLDSPLKGLEQYEGAPVDEIRGATRRALRNLVQLAIDEPVDFVLIAGDLYDGTWQDFHTGLCFAAEMGRLREANIPVYLISGNHDAENRMTRSLRLPDNVVKLSARKPQSEPIDDLGVMIHGQGFAKRDVQENLAAGYPSAVPGCFNIGLLHTCATGREGHDAYAPCTLDDLRSKQYDYWALGHVHQRERLSASEAIYFSGNLQGRHIRERGAKGCLMVTVDERHRAEVEFAPLDVLRWELLEVDAAGAATADDLVERFSHRLGEHLDAAEGRPLAVRVEVRGACRAHQAMAAEPVRWTNELRQTAADVAGGRVWLEKVRLRTSDAAEGDPQHSCDGPLGELAALVDSLRREPHELRRLAGEAIDELKRKLPAELKEGADALAFDDDAWLEALLDQAHPLLSRALVARAEAP